MVVGKEKRAGGTTSDTIDAKKKIHSSPHSLRKYEDAIEGWRARVKVLASSTLSGASREEGGRTIALPEEDFRKSGFRARETVAVLAGPRRLVIGRVSPLPSAALRPGSVGLAASSKQSLDCEEGARVRLHRLSDTAVKIVHADAVELVLEAAPPGRMALASSRAYLERFTAGRKALLARAAAFCAHGLFARDADRLTVSFEGVPHAFRVAGLRPGLVEEGGDDGESDRDGLAAHFSGLSLSGGKYSGKSGVGAISSPEVPGAKYIGHYTPTGMRNNDSTRIEVDERSDQSPRREESTPLYQKENSTLSPVMAEASPAVTAHRGSKGTGSAARARLEAFYKEHNPEKLDGIDGILVKYAGREEVLFFKLEKKYGVASLRAATSSGNEGVYRLMTASGAPGSGKRLAHPNIQSVEMESFPPTPSPGRQNIEAHEYHGDAPGAKSWGYGETLWLITDETAVELRAADTPRDIDDAPPEPQSRDSAKNTPYLTIPAGKEGVFEENDGDWSSVGGLSSQIQQLREAIELPLRSPEILERYGVRPPRGVLLHGPPGTGKTTLARAAAKACRCHVIVVNGSELMSRFVGESEGALRQTFAEASRRAPCLIVFDEVDTLCPRRDQANSEAHRRVVSMMLALLDGMDAKEQVVVIACTNRPQALDPALRRPGRLDSEVEVGVPDATGRAQILRVLLRGVPHAMEVAPSSDFKRGKGNGVIEDIAARTHGFVGADLQLLVKEAALQALRRTRIGRETFPDGSLSRTRDAEGEKCGKVGESTQRRGGEGLIPTLTQRDFDAALRLVAPSGLREVAVEVPTVRWDDIGGMEGVKQSLREVVEWPLRHPEAFKRMGLSPPRGVLLYGPPGCSKTLMARALATESGMNFLAVKGPELLSKWLGESERAMQALFKRARAAAPTIIFFDEVDALASTRGGGGDGTASATERVLTQLLTELDGIQPVKRLVVVAATNRPDVIDPALLRPGRLDRLVYVPPPDKLSRREILRLSLAKVPTGADIDPEQLAERTEGFSGAEVVALCREASICALEEDRSATQIFQKHLFEALGQIKPQITPSVLASYVEFHGGVG